MTGQALCGIPVVADAGNVIEVAKNMPMDEVFIPIRTWEKTTGPGESVFTASATNGYNMAVIKSPARLPAISISRFTIPRLLSIG